MSPFYDLNNPETRKYLEINELLDLLVRHAKNLNYEGIYRVKQQIIEKIKEMEGTIVERADLDFLLELLDDDYEGEWALSPDDWIRLKELRGKYGK